MSVPGRELQECLPMNIDFLLCVKECILGKAAILTCRSVTALSELLDRLTAEGLVFHQTSSFSLIGDFRVNALITAEPGVLEKICSIANFVNNYQI